MAVIFNSISIFCLILLIQSKNHLIFAQHWWDFENLDNPNERPMFTPRPEIRYTHDSRLLQLGMQPNDVIVNVPKAGMGNFIGFSQTVFYDYTWASWPPTVGRLVNVFLGIPYAAPPVGDLRFMRPVPAYINTRYSWYAKRFRSACLQERSLMQKKLLNFKDFNEDCLYLNIFAPNRTWESPEVLYPVVVHIHGGSFTYGSSHMYPGHTLASMGLVVVTFNYRLGPLGFLATGDFESVGNYGLWDQLMVLEWVRDNIRWFRGDPKRITIMGESAGAASVGIHLVSPVTNMPGNAALFHRAIMMSGSELSPWAVADPDNVKTRRYANQLAAALGCASSNGNMHAQMTCLRYYRDPDLLIAAANKIDAPNGAPQQVWSPVVDGTAGYLPRHPRFERSQNRFSRVPLLASTVHSEAAWLVQQYLQRVLNKNISEPLTTADVHRIVLALVNKTNAYRVNQTVEELQLRYTWWSNLANDSARTDELVHMFSDYYVKSPLYEDVLSQASAAAAAASAGDRADHRVFLAEWAYRGLNDTTTSQLGIYHGVDTAFVFGFPFMNRSFSKELYDKDVFLVALNQTWNYPSDTNMSEFAMILWYNFITVGEPTPFEIQNLTWLAFTPENQNYAHLYINSSLHQNYRQSQMAFWRQRFTYLAEPMPAMDESRIFPVYDVMVATICLAIALALVTLAVIIVIYCLCQRPRPEKFKTKVRLRDGDLFASAFQDQFADYHQRTATGTRTLLSTSDSYV